MTEAAQIIIEVLVWSWLVAMCYKHWHKPRLIKQSGVIYQRSRFQPRDLFGKYTYKLKSQRKPIWYSDLHK